jgi:hypothetical protein
MKDYYIQYNIGSCKYAVSYHDGVTMHKDGSPFYGIRTFKNEVDTENFITKLVLDGYTEKVKTI